AVRQSARLAPVPGRGTVAGRTGRRNQRLHSPRAVYRLAERAVPRLAHRPRLAGVGLMQLRDLICRYPLFAALGPAALDAWLPSAEELVVGLGETLFQTGTAGEHAYLVQEGRVRVLRPTKSGREVPLGSYRFGDVFGEYALLPPGKNTATCRSA